MAPRACHTGLGLGQSLDLSWGQGGLGRPSVGAGVRGVTQGLRMEGLLCLRLASLPKPTIYPDAPRVTLLKQESTALPDPPGPLLQEKNSTPGTSLAVQRLRPHTSTAGGMGLIPGQGTKILNAAQHSQFIQKGKKKKNNS